VELEECLCLNTGKLFKNQLRRQNNEYLWSFYKARQKSLITTIRCLTLKRLYSLRTKTRQHEEYRHQGKWYLYVTIYIYIYIFHETFRWHIYLLGIAMKPTWTYRVSQYTSNICIYSLLSCFNIQRAPINGRIRLFTLNGGAFWWKSVIYSELSRTREE